MNYNIIATGSGGNAVVLDRKILIDCGVSYKKLAPWLDDIRLVLLTHAHFDHFKPTTVAKIAKEHPLIRFACCEWMAPLLRQASVEAARIDLIRPGMQEYTYPGTCTIRAESVPHDVPNCCWHIRFGSCKVFYCTDAGTLDGIEAKDYHLYLIEANHTKQEISERIARKQQRGEFAYEVRAAENHLSREQADEWLIQNAGSWSEIFFLHQHRDKE